jgi:hypothetical protein
VCDWSDDIPDFVCTRTHADGHADPGLNSEIRDTPETKKLCEFIFFIHEITALTERTASVEGWNVCL